MKQASFKLPAVPSSSSSSSTKVIAVVKNEKIEEKKNTNVPVKIVENVYMLL